ncbi:lysozyme family protein [Caenimonas soli]|jgi:hypothetical protein|uniref:hypothetical protein n=1 Tax=Caenimonas soli TaxID=2735555 RepID=UPI001553BF87|nr:hypothetical protein [Caenimonas soli]NPC54539.1 hypothetical protein [Caenimonas soli]
MNSHRWATYSAVAGFTTVAFAVVALELVALAGWMGWHPTRATQLAAAQAQATIQAVQEKVAQAPVAAVPAPRPEDGYYDQLRSRIRWVSTRIGEEKLPTPDPDSRILLVKSAAQRAGLNEVGLGFKDVYGIINAETSWVPRTGASKDGTPNLGIAQFEPATAKLLGVRNPDDPVESVHVAALHMKEAALWSQARIAGLKLDADERAAKLREGVSIYYNLSSRGRAAWNGKNTKKLPRETQLHIHNARLGAQQADILARGVLTASN